MIRPRSLPPLARNILLGLAAAALLAGVGVLLNRSSQVRLEGSILKVRVVPTDENACVAVVDLRLKNPSSALFQVKQVKIVVTGPDGAALEGQPVPEMDLDRILGYYKVLGTRYTPVLKERDRLRGGIEEDRTVAASFAVSEKVFQDRKGLILQIQDADGMSSQIGVAPVRP